VSPYQLGSHDELSGKVVAEVVVVTKVVVTEVVDSKILLSPIGSSKLHGEGEHEHSPSYKNYYFC